MQSLSNLVTLSHGQKASLKKANILTVTDLVLISPVDLAKKCRIVPSEAQDLVNLVCKEVAPRICPLDDIFTPRDQIFTTGDSELDHILGGGIRTRKLWEIVGESAAGKTQLSLQLALCVQLPVEYSGISGSSCFLSTSWTLPTQRLSEIINNHPLLSPSICSLSDIHTLKTPTIPILIHVLSVTLPNFLDELAARPGAKPVKLLIIDALTELFHSTSQASSLTMQERSKNLAEISTLIHSLAHQRNMAVIVLNEVIDTFNRSAFPGGSDDEVLYNDQAQFFGRANSIPGEDRKEAALGLAWANQVNVRMMLSKTSRMHQLGDLDARSGKRRRLDVPIDTPHSAPYTTDEVTRLRRFTVIFSSVSPPTSLDYIITQAGVTFISDDTSSSLYSERIPSPDHINNEPNPSLTVIPSTEPTEIDLQHTLQGLDPELLSDDLLPLPLEDTVEAEDVDGPQQEVDDEWDTYWTNAEIGSDIYTQVDLDALNSSNTG